MFKMRPIPLGLLTDCVTKMEINTLDLLSMFCHFLSAQALSIVSLKLAEDSGVKMVNS